MLQNFWVPSFSLRIIRSSLLMAKKISHGFTTRIGGASELPYQSLNLGHTQGDFLLTIAKNYELISSEAQFSLDKLSQLKQVHSATVAVLSEAEFRQRESDAAVTANPLVLSVLTADCVPIVMGDKEGRAAIIHAGWRGTEANIVKNTIAALKELGADPTKIYAAMGPSIGPCCFAVQESVANLFTNLAPKAVETRRGQPYVDLWHTNRFLLEQAGVRSDHIEYDPPCSVCTPQLFFSHRRDRGDTGRNMAFVVNQ